MRQGKNESNETTPKEETQGEGREVEQCMYGQRLSTETIRKSDAHERGKCEIASTFAQNIVSGGIPDRQARPTKGEITLKETKETDKSASK